MLDRAQVDTLVMYLIWRIPQSPRDGYIRFGTFYYNYYLLYLYFYIYIFILNN